MSFLTRIRKIFHAASSLLKKHGGPRRLISRIFRLWHDEGAKAILHRTRIISEATPLKDGYLNWIQSYDGTSDIDLASITEKLSSLKQNLLISIVVTLNARSEEKLLAVIKSITNQIYPHWELFLVSSEHTGMISPALTNLVKGDHRICMQLEKSTSIEYAINGALERAKGTHLILLDGNGILNVHALYWVVEELCKHPDADFIYADEDKLDKSGSRFAPHFKPDWNPDLFMTGDYAGPFKVFRTELVRKLGGIRVGYGESLYYDLALRIIEKIGDHQIRHICRILYHGYSSLDSVTAEEQNEGKRVEFACHAVRSHLERCSIKAEVNESDEISGYLRVRYELPVTPQVSLIIPTRNGLELLKLCVESITTKTSYPNYNIIIIDNGSDDPATIDYLNSLKNGNPSIEVIRDDGPFNFSRLNNLAVKYANGSLIGLLNNDIEVITANWLTEMVSQALRPGIGIVGARLWYPDDTIQHAGVVMAGGVAGHVHKKLPRGDTGYFGRAVLVQNFVAVTAACLVMQKKIYDEVGGLDEKFAVAFNDVDFCMRVSALGYRNLWTPYAELFHHESATRGYEDTPEKMNRFMKEMKYMQERWGVAMFNDPAYNPNLHAELKDFSLASPPAYFPQSAG